MAQLELATQPKSSFARRRRHLVNMRFLSLARALLVATCCQSARARQTHLGPSDSTRLCSARLDSTWRHTNLLFAPQPACSSQSSNLFARAAALAPPARSTPSSPLLPPLLPLLPPLLLLLLLLLLLHLLPSPLLGREKLTPPAQYQSNSSASYDAPSSRDTLRSPGRPVKILSLSLSRRLPACLSVCPLLAQSLFDLSQVSSSRLAKQTVKFCSPDAA